MAVKIRLRRMGTRGKPFYRVVVADSRSPRDGRFVTLLGYYDPRTEPPVVKIDEEKALLWLRRGAQPTDTAAALLKKEGIIDKFRPAKPEKEPAAVEPTLVAEEPEPEQKQPVRRKRTATATRKPKAEAPAEPEVVVEPEAAAEPDAPEPKAAKPKAAAKPRAGAKSKGTAKSKAAAKSKAIAESEEVVESEAAGEEQPTAEQG